MKPAWLLFFLLLLPHAALAGAGNQFLAGQAVQLQPDTAYLLVRTRVPEGSFDVDIVFIRLLSNDALRAAAERQEKDPDAKQEPNVVSLWWRDPYLESGGEKTYLMAVKPGAYIIGGHAFGAPHGSMYKDDSDGSAGSCLCLGTVSFEAKAGTITDLGYFLSAREDKPITVPELAGYERKFGNRVPIAMTVRPPVLESPVPDAFKDLPRVAVDYRAAGPIRNYFENFIERMAPVPGVLDYDKDGRVIDLKAAPGK